MSPRDDSSPTRDHEREPTDPRLSRRAVRLQMTGVGLEFGATAIGGLAAGYYLDEWLGTEPIFVVVCVFGALAGSMTHLVMLSRRLDRLRRAEEERSADQS